MDTALVNVEAEPCDDGKTKRKRTWKFNPMWYDGRGWLEYFDGKMFCSTCKRASLPGAWTTTGCSRLRLEAVQQREKSGSSHAQLLMRLSTAPSHCGAPAAVSAAGKRKAAKVPLLEGPVAGKRAAAEIEERIETGETLVMVESVAGPVEAAVEVACAAAHPLTATAPPVPSPPLSPPLLALASLMAAPLASSAPASPPMMALAAPPAAAAPPSPPLIALAAAPLAASAPASPPLITLAPLTAPQPPSPPLFALEPLAEAPSPQLVPLALPPRSRPPPPARPVVLLAPPVPPPPLTVAPPLVPLSPRLLQPPVAAAAAVERVLPAQLLSVAQIRADFAFYGLDARLVERHLPPFIGTAISW